MYSIKQQLNGNLEGRRQLLEIRCNKNGTIHRKQSKITSVQRPVPPGSVLGPVLFIRLTDDTQKQLQQTHRNKYQHYVKQ